MKWAGVAWPAQMSRGSGQMQIGCGMDEWWIKRVLLAMFAAMMLHLVGLRYASGHEGHDSLSQYYASWFQPPTREKSCCDMTDCAVAEVRVERNGDVYARSSI